MQELLQLVEDYKLALTSLKQDILMFVDVNNSDVDSFRIETVQSIKTIETLGVADDEDTLSKFKILLAQVLVKEARRPTRIVVRISDDMFHYQLHSDFMNLCTKLLRLFNGITPAELANSVSLVFTNSLREAQAFRAIIGELNAQTPAVNELFKELIRANTEEEKLRVIEFSDTPTTQQIARRLLGMPFSDKLHSYLTPMRLSLESSEFDSYRSFHMTIGTFVMDIYKWCRDNIYASKARPEAILAKLQGFLPPFKDELFNLYPLETVDRSSKYWNNLKVVEQCHQLSQKVSAYIAINDNHQNLRGYLSLIKGFVTVYHHTLAALTDADVKTLEKVLVLLDMLGDFHEMLAPEVQVSWVDILQTFAELGNDSFEQVVLKGFIKEVKIDSDLAKDPQYLAQLEAYLNRRPNDDRVLVLSTEAWMIRSKNASQGDHTQTIRDGQRLLKEIDCDGNAEALYESVLLRVADLKIANKMELEGCLALRAIGEASFFDKIKDTHERHFLACNTPARKIQNLLSQAEFYRSVFQRDAAAKAINTASNIADEAGRKDFKKLIFEENINFERHYSTYLDRLSNHRNQSLKLRYLSFAQAKREECIWTKLGCAGAFSL